MSAQIPRQAFDVVQATLQLIDRSELLAVLDRAAAKRVTVISAPAVHLAAADPPPPGERLSTGELLVLRYLPTNLSRPEIATELSVSLNTVSTQIRSIYAKLQVRDRSSAVQRARELRLLATGRTR